MQRCQSYFGPSRTGEGLFRCIENALEQSGLKKEDIDYISRTWHGDNVQ
ncbi:hypothetical protein [Maribacter litopenaei]